MRLCFIASGTNSHSQRWVNYFAQREHEVHLISSSFSNGFDSRIQIHPLIRLLPKIWPVSGYCSGLLWLFQTRKLVDMIMPDILDAHYLGVPACLATASGFRPLILTAYGSDILIDLKRNPTRRFLAKRALSRADRIICVSSTLEEEIIKLGGAPSKIQITPIGIDTQKFSPDLRNEALLRRLNIADSKIVISTRNLKAVYDVETLIRSIPRVLGEVPKAKFLIVGEGDQRSFLEDLGNNLGVSESVRFIGWVPNHELPDYLASSDVYVSTSLSDGTSISLLEAFGCGLPPVVTYIPANRPWVDDGESGFLVPTGDYNMLAEKVILLLKDKQTRSRFGEIGRKTVVERADYGNEMSKVERIYEEVKCAKP